MKRDLTPEEERMLDKLANLAFSTDFKNLNSNRRLDVLWECSNRGLILDDRK